jgi:hypothetical protein
MALTYSMRTSRLGRLLSSTAWMNWKIAGQQRGAVFEAHHGARRLGVVALAGPAGGGGDWSSSSWSIPIASVVPVSL